MATTLHPAAVTPERPAVLDESTLNAYRRLGFLLADLDPMNRLPPEAQTGLEDCDPATAEYAGRYYCGTIGVEFMHIQDRSRRQWIQERMESEAPGFDRDRILELLTRAEIFEQFLQSRYLGTKRFSIEGVEALLPCLDQMLESAAEHRTSQVVLAMSHRGRLNVMVHTVDRPAAEILAGFEDVDPRSILGGGDVKYHMGATGDHSGRNGHTVNIHLVSNPSHLEAVDPVAIGRVRAKQTRLRDFEHDRVFPIVLHGDAAFAGQGILAETLNLAELHGYRVGGTVHVVVNNLIGFTTEPKALHSSRFASDVARRVPVPIFHVNGEDPDAVARVAQIAVDYRYAFRSDVVVDLIGFRRHGHSEVDDPTITQPLLYKKIQAHPPLWRIFAEAIGLPEGEAERRAEAVRAELDAAHKAAGEIEKKPTLRTLPAYWDRYQGGRCLPEHDEVKTGLAVRGDRRADGAAHHGAGGLPRSQEDPGPAGAAGGDGAGQAAARLRHGRGARLRLAGQGGDSRPPLRPGQPARHLQPAPRGAHRRRGRRRAHAAPARLSRPGAVRDLRLDALRGRGARLRVRLQPRLPRGAGAAGRRSSATSPTAPRSSSTSSSPPARTSGACSPASSCCCRTATKGRDRSTRAPAWSATCSSPPRTTSRSASRRRRRSTSTCCAARPCAPGASRCS